MSTVEEKREAMLTELDAQIAEHGLGSMQFVLDTDSGEWTEPANYRLSIKDVTFDGSTNEILVVLEAEVT